MPSATSSFVTPRAIVEWGVTKTDPIWIDPERMHQVLSNLLDNAVHHGGGNAVSLSASSSNGGLQLAVTDNGPGITPADIDRIFHRFHQGDGTTGGTGLGLAISRWIVELHGGSTRAEPVHPHGMRIVVELPLEEPSL